MMEARGLRADRRRARRAPARGSGDASQRLSAAALGHAGGRDRAADPQAPPGQLLPELPGAAPALRAGAAGGGPAGLRLRRLDAPRRPAGREPRAADLQERGQPDLRRRWMSTSRRSATRPLEGRYPYLFLDAKVEKVRDGGRVVNKALVIAHGVHETGRREILVHRRRRGRDRGVLDRVPARPGRARPGRRPAGHLRRARRAEGGDREGPRLRLAALHRPLPPRLPRARPQGPARRCWAR